MACGVAPFVVRREWLPDGLIDTGVNGYLVGTDVGEMVEALLAAVDRGDIHRVGAAAAVRAAEDFDIDLQAARYTELLGASRMSGTPSSGQA